jgi:hypothetical protein
MRVHTKYPLWLATVRTAHEKPVSIVMNAVDPFPKRLSDIGSWWLICVNINTAALAIWKTFVFLPVVTEQITEKVDGYVFVMKKVWSRAVVFVCKER